MNGHYLYYLKPSIKAEPLIWQWYAWSYLIPPHTAGCNILDRHIRIMQSYIQAPQVHEQAVKNPKFLGGPFIDLVGNQSDAIKELLELTQKDCHHLISVAKALKEWDRVLQTEAVGDSLENLYTRIPDQIKGLIELVYDTHNHPSIRLVEALFYKKYYTTQNQCIALSDTTTDYRPFVLSTPRLKKETEVYLKLGFDDERLDALFSMRSLPKKYGEIREAFNISPTEEALMKTFFTEVPPELPESKHYTGDGVRLRYFGHACVLIQSDSTSILIDPVISYKFDSNLPRYTFEDLPDKIDYVLVTHNHQDHVLLETLIQLRHKVEHVVFPNSQKGSLIDPSLRLILKTLGFRSLVGLDDFESLSIPNGEITGLPFFGEHSDLNIQTKLAHFIMLKGRRFIFAADSNNIDDRLYDYIFEFIGSIDILFLGMECDGAPLSWLYGALLTDPIKRSYDNNRTLSGSNCEKAWSIVKKSKCKQTYIYAMGQEPWLNHIMALKYSENSLQIIESNKLIDKCRESGIAAERLYGKKEWVV